MQSTPRRVLLLAAALTGVAVFVSCGPGEPVDELAGRKREILSALGNEVVLPTLRSFATEAAALETATAAYADAPSDETRTAAQAAWRDAMGVWQRAEIMQIGPAGMGGTLGVRGGLNLRDEIYSWPVESTCRVDEETLAGVDDPDALAAMLVNVRGLDALEHLLFVEGTEHSCEALDGWDALDEDTLTQRRARYAHTAAVLVTQRANELRDAWEPTGGNHVGALATAGDTSEVYRTAQGALDDLSGAMLYIDTSLRDMKLAEPAGISERCPTDTCLDALESRPSGTSRAHLLENLRGFQQLFLGAGANGLGFDDLLVDVGAAELATMLTEAIEAAIQAVEAIEGTLAESIESGAPTVMAAYDALGPAQRIFKVDVVTVLDLTPAAVGPGDND